MFPAAPSLPIGSIRDARGIMIMASGTVLSVESAGSWPEDVARGGTFESRSVATRQWQLLLPKENILNIQRN